MGKIVSAAEHSYQLLRLHEDQDGVESSGKMIVS